MIYCPRQIRKTLVLHHVAIHIPRFIPITLFAVSICSLCGAQDHDYRYLFISKVAAADSVGTAVRGCHIINKTQRLGTVSDEYGAFRITAEINDSITFSAIGYEKLTIAVTDSMYDNTRVIRLKPVAYALEEVNIKPYQLNLPPISKYEIYTPPLPNQGGVNIPVSFSPVSFFYNRFSKEAKQKRHYQKVLEGSSDEAIISEKFNGSIVSRLTGLKDDELINFMSWCGFTKEFLRNMSPETIKREIKKKYAEYVKNKTETTE